MLQKTANGMDYVLRAMGAKSRLFPLIFRFFNDAIAAADIGLTENIYEQCRRLVRRANIKIAFYRLTFQRKKREKHELRRDVAELMMGNSQLTAGISTLLDGPLTQAMNRYGSDKGRASLPTPGHNYTAFYQRLFAGHNVERLFELGIGMLSGKPGASLYGWRDYFPNAHIFSADIDPDCIFQDDRITTYLVDELDAKAVNAMFAKIGSSFDIIIDDGLHDFIGPSAFFEIAFKHLKPGGLYIIEDIHITQQARYRAMLSLYDSVIINIPNHQNLYCNALAVIAN